MSDLIEPIFSATFKESFYIEIEFGLNLLAKLIGKIFGSCQMVNILGVEGIGVIFLTIGLSVVRHVASSCFSSLFTTGSLKSVLAPRYVLDHTPVPVVANNLDPNKNVTER